MPTLAIGWGRVHGVALVSVFALVFVAGCNDERRYVGDPAVVQVALTEDTAPAFTDEETEVFIVEQRVELPIALPSATVLSDLQTAADERGDLPFPRMPWIAGVSTISAP